MYTVYARIFFHYCMYVLTNVRRDDPSSSSSSLPPQSRCHHTLENECECSFSRVSAHHHHHHPDSPQFQRQEEGRPSPPSRSLRNRRQEEGVTLHPFLLDATRRGSPPRCVSFPVIDAMWSSPPSLFISHHHTRKRAFALVFEALSAERVLPTRTTTTWRMTTMAAAT